MKDILKVMRFDYLTAKPDAQIVFIFIMILCLLLSLFISPYINAWISLGAMVYVIPLQNAADKYGFNKFYGMIPVKRRSITQARFLYVFLVHFASEIISVVFCFISLYLKLYRILPDQQTSTMQMISEGYANAKLVVIMPVVMTMVLAVIFSYMEMMGQIFGRENEFRIIIISLAVITAVCLGFITLSNRGMVPLINIRMPETAGEYLITGLAMNIISFVLSILFGEMTANRLEKREL